MLHNLKHDLFLFIQARTGATLALFVWAALVALASLTAFAFLCVALYDWVALQLSDVFDGLVWAGRVFPALDGGHRSFRQDGIAPENLDIADRPIGQDSGFQADHAAHLRGTAKREQVGELTILTPNLRPASIASGRD